MKSLQDRVALAVHTQYDALPEKCKPGIDNAGQKQWVPLSGIVLSNEDNTGLHCVALATGMKCLPASKVPTVNGCVLHDWHAEVLAIRVFNSFLLQECINFMTSGQSDSTYLRRREKHEVSVSGGLQPFTIKESMKLHMYCSEAPCGDASMELVMNAQDDPTPWNLDGEAQARVSEGQAVLNGQETLQIPAHSALKGRGFFSELGIVRRKPARADSPLTLSKSCSDKLALKQCTSLLSSLTCLLICPENAYISSLVLPESQHVPNASQRAFADMGRMRPLKGKTWPGGYAFQPFDVLPTTVEFVNSRRNSGPKSTNISAGWNPYAQQTLVNGVLQGRKQIDPKGASAFCRQKMWGVVALAIGISKISAIIDLLKLDSYSSLKQTKLLNDRRVVKAEAKSLGLRGWVPNKVDDFAINSTTQNS